MIRWRTEVRSSDVAAVGQLVTETGFFNEEEILVAVELVEETLARGKASGYEFAFADKPDEAGVLLGYTCFGPIPGTQSTYDLYWIAVSPSQQGQGIGAGLMRESERLALAMGATQMYLDTAGRDQYKPTRAFYERLGYQKAAVLQDFFAPGDDKVIYKRKL